MFLSTNNGYRRNTCRSTRQVMAALMFRIATLRNGTSRNCWWETTNFVPSATAS